MKPLRRCFLLSVFVLVLLVEPAWAETCHTVILPESDGTGGQIYIPIGVTYFLVDYTPPPTATRVGLEFWSHGFPPDAPPSTIYFLAYLNSPWHVARRLLNATNAGPEANSGWFVNFPMSTWIHPDEQFLVVGVNHSGAPRVGYLIVTIRECYP